MKHTIVMRDKDTAYGSDWLWLPKSRINEYAVRAACTVDGARCTVEVWKDTERHILVPREFSIPSQWWRGVNYVDLNPKTFPHVDFHCLATTRNQTDAAVWGRLQDVKSGVLHLGCGKGKTVHALRKIAHEGGPSLIVVNTQDLLEQWIDRTQEFLQIGGRPINRSDIGIVKGAKYQQWDRPIVIAMIQTLSKRTVPETIRSKFKVVVYDECHHLSAPTWIHTASIGYGVRLGLSATPDDGFGVHNLYMKHLGGVFLSDVTQDVQPKCVFLHTDINIPMNKEVRSSNGQISVGKLHRVMGGLVRRNNLIVSEINKALNKDRTVLVVSGSTDHCIALASMVEGSGLCIGDVDLDVRRENVNNCRVIFGTMPLGKEGLDRAELDLVIIATPFNNKNVLQQVVGRVQRPAGKPPIVLIIQDDMIPPYNKSCNTLRDHLDSWGYDTSDVTRRHRV